MTTRTIYIVPTRQANTFPIASFPARAVTVARRVAIPVRSSKDGGSITVLTRKPMQKDPAAAPQPLKYCESVSAKRPTPSVLEDPTIEEILGFRNTENHPVRKRERLNHLTAEEKLNRRKLKNRVAAQTARDRKKLRTCKLEEAVRKLVAENEILRAENKRINTVCNELKLQKQELERALQEERQQKTSDIQPSLGSAASIRGPQQREQATVLLRILLLLSFLTSTCKKSSTTSLRKMRILNSFVQKFSVVKKMKKCLPLLARLPVPRKSAGRLQWIARHRISF